MMRRLLIALMALVMLGGVAGGAMAQNTAKDGQTASAGPDNEQNPAGQEPGCNPSDQQPNKCPGGNGGGGGGGGGGRGGPKAGTCEDGEDNEPDGFTDGDDPDCQQPGCKPSSQTPNKCDETTDNSPCGAGNDDDGDGVCDGTDNCPNVANPGQEDADNDGTGDACEQVAAGTCTTGGLGIISKFEAQDPGHPGDETLAYAILGTENELGPISRELHAQLEPNLGPLQPVGHEVVCVVATIDNAAAS